jgi:hypothetical protein
VGRRRPEGPLGTTWLVSGPRWARGHPEPNVDQYLIDRSHAFTVACAVAGPVGLPQIKRPVRPLYWWWPPSAGIRIPAPLSNLGPGSTTRVVGPVTGRDFRPGASLIVAPWCVCGHRPLCRPPARDPRPCRGEDQSTVDFRPGVSRHGSAGRCRAATGRWPFRDQARRRGAPTGPAPRATGRPARPAGFPTFVGSAGRRRLRPWGHDSD